MSNSILAKLKKPRVDQTNTPIKILPLPSESENVAGKTSSKDSAAFVLVRARSACPKKQVDSTAPYIKEFIKYMEEDFVAALDAHSLNELDNSF